MRVWLVMGSASCVYDDIAGIPPADYTVLAVNSMCALSPVPIWGGATLHPENAMHYRAGRPGDWRLFSWAMTSGVTDLFPKMDQWNGTSALYAVRVAMSLGAERIVVVGAPLDDGPHAAGGYRNASLAPHLRQYRIGWEKAVPVIRDKVRSASGWTAELLGRPSQDWLCI